MPTPSSNSYSWEKLENQGVKQPPGTMPLKRLRSPFKWTDLTPPRNLGLVPETSHARPWGPVSPQALVPLSLAAKTHLCPSVLPQLQSKPHWLLPRQMLFILLQGLTSSHMYKYNYVNKKWHKYSQSNILSLLVQHSLISTLLEKKIQLWSTQILRTNNGPWPHTLKT